MAAIIPQRFRYFSSPTLRCWVVSPDSATRDRVEKRIIYARAGVREYWTIDLRNREVTIFECAEEGRFGPGRTLGEADTITSRVFADLSIPTRELLVSA